ncbi:MAG: MFS transporter [Planctomycetaceae bacterium]
MPSLSPPLPRNVRLLGWASFWNDVASEMVYPLLPQFLIVVLGGTRLELGAIEGVAESVASLLKLGSGIVSDRLQRRKGLVIAGYLLASLVRPLLGLVQQPWHVFLLRTSDRIGKGVRTSPRDALIADSTPVDERGRAFGFHRAMDHLGAALGPLAAMAFLHFRPDDLRTLFLLTAIPGFIVIGLLLWGLQEVPRRLSDKPALKLNWSQLPSRFRWFLLALLLFTLGNSSDAFLLVRAGELGVPPLQLPLLWLVFHLAKSFGNARLGTWIDRIGVRRPVLAGWLVYAVVYLAFGFATSAWHVWALFLLYAVFYSLTEVAEKKFVSMLVAPEQQGLAFGWFHFAIGIAALPSSLLFGGLYDAYGPRAAFGWGAALAVLALPPLLLAMSSPRTGPDAT